MKKNSKRYNEILKNAIKEKRVSAKEALELVKKNSTAKFDESIDVSLKINLKQSKGGDLSLRTVVNLPNGSGKKRKVAVLCEPDKIDEAKKAGADMVGSDDLIEKIAAGKFDFTKLICTPAMMSKIGKHGKVLGPKGLMPNPKLGTVTPNVGKAVQDAKGGQVEYRTEKAGIIHVGVGKMSFSEGAIVENICSLVDAVNKAKPSGAKGTYIEKIFVSSTMGPGIKLDVGPLLERAGES